MEKEVAKIVEIMQKTWEWWEMLPPSLSPYPYNYSVAQEFYPLQKVEKDWEKLEIRDMKTSINFWLFGYWWLDYEKPTLQNTNVVDAQSLPDTLEQEDEALLHQAIRCEKSGKLFRITQQELRFYRQQWIPLPRKHPDIRYYERLEKRPQQ